jgi:hypothetical protein
MEVCVLISSQLYTLDMATEGTEGEKAGQGSGEERERERGDVPNLSLGNDQSFLHSSCGDSRSRGLDMVDTCT